MRKLPCWRLRIVTKGKRNLCTQLLPSRSINPLLKISVGDSIWNKLSSIKSCLIFDIEAKKGNPALQPGMSSWGGTAILVIQKSSCLWVMMGLLQWNKMMEFGSRTWNIKIHYLFDSPILKFTVGFNLGWPDFPDLKPGHFARDRNARARTRFLSWTCAQVRHRHRFCQQHT